MRKLKKNSTITAVQIPLQQEADGGSLYSISKWRLLGENLQYLYNNKKNPWLLAN